MGYYDAADVPVYDHLARQFAVCDRWFSSVPGATWPNRLYAISGGAARSRDDLPHNRPPMYNQPSFVRHLDAHGVSWRWYSFEVGTLRLADARYKLGHHDRFAFFSRENLNWKAALEIRMDAFASSFLEDAARGTLPSVSWIDPNFSNFNPIGFQPNDDHAPADIKDGQELVLAVYHALAAGPQWDKTMLVIAYDEHGGFYDHVPPPGRPRRQPADVRPLRRARPGAGRLTVDRARLGIKDGLRPHLDHQDDPAALRPRRAQPTQTTPRPARPGNQRRAPALPRNTRRAGP